MTCQLVKGIFHGEREERRWVVPLQEKREERRKGEVASFTLGKRKNEGVPWEIFF